MIKFTILLKRNQNMTHDEFVDHHKNRHAELFMSIPAVKTYVRRYVQQHGLPVQLPGMPTAKYDGVTELWFDKVEDIAAVFTDADYMARIRPDEETFLDLHACDFIVSQENVVLH